MIQGIFIGLGASLVFFLCSFFIYKLIKKPKGTKLTKEQLEELKKRNEGFQNIMNYDYNKALERR